MDSTVFKHKHHYQQQNQHFNKRSRSNNNNNNSINNHNNSNQNSIFILNTATNNILPNSRQIYYTDLNDNNVVTSAASSSSVWSSASSTMCSPAAHALQKLFNCSSTSLRFNPGSCSGIESKAFKSKSEILKKKSKFWKYLEAEANEKNIQRGIEDVAADTSATEKKQLSQSFKCKSKSYESDNQTQEDLSDLLEYSCSLCDSCRCVDCQIGYFDYENSDDSNSEYSFHLSAYEEDDEEADGSDNDNMPQQPMELKSYANCCYTIENKQQSVRKFELDYKLPTNCSYCNCNDSSCTKAQCCQQCCSGTFECESGGEARDHEDVLATQDH